jgi:hypothetical protein
MRPPKRLIRSPALPMPSTYIPRMLTLCGERRARHTLIRIRRLFNADLLVRRLAGAAAHAEEPEEAGCETESDG